MALTITERSTWHGCPVLGADGEEVGTVERVLYDQTSDRMEWVRLDDGKLVPLAGARVDRERDAVQVAFTEGQIRSAPDVDTERVGDDESSELLSHYRAAGRAGDRSPEVTWGNLGNVDERLGELTSPTGLAELDEESTRPPD